MPRDKLIAANTPLIVINNSRDYGATCHVGDFMEDDDQPGFWESNGYPAYGDPWLEQRYS